MLPIPYGRQEITAEDIEAVTRTLRSEYLTQGPAIATLEQQFASYLGSRFAVACSNGTAALHLACLALGLQPGQRVITSPLTFAASANCALYCGAQVDFVDIDPSTGLIDLTALESQLKRHPKGTFAGVIPVDYAGYPVDLARLHELSREYGFWVLEDACHAPGGGYAGGFRCGDGRFSQASIFSFHPVKHIAAGEGGMITTNCPKLYEDLKALRTHGITKDPQQLHSASPGGWYYEMQSLGFNYRLTDIQAALASSQLIRAEVNLQRRREIARRYDEALAPPGLELIVPEPGVDHAYHLYVVRLSQRKELYDFLQARQIYVQVHYIPIHLHPYYRDLGWKCGDFPQAERFYEQCLSLPMYPTLSQAQQKYVIDSITEFLERS
ncbi:UDP-4-amino-4,6-dideoxy-N-acetyl-beta-L-altrosamine transaminase [bacterium]|nr:UDP-4-amino-4,6-dideoxy-N-acetyl-beta-L-altrosamine transaminase [bacterium]